VHFGITGNIHTDATREAALNVIDNLKKNNISFVVDLDFNRFLGINVDGIAWGEFCRQSDLILSFGGDGTLLDIAKRIGDKKTPILGVNTGHLGFLTEISPEILPQRLDDILNGNYSIEKRMMIEARVPGNSKKTYLAVNDFVIDKGGYPRSMKASLSIGNEFCHLYTFDGLIISTATGSTAYSLSAGGPIIYPSIKDILITPIYPHMLSARPMIVPGELEIEIEIVSGSESVFMHADGRLATNLHIGDKIQIKKSLTVLNLVHFPEHNFFRVLRAKMNW